MLQLGKETKIGKHTFARVELSVLEAFRDWVKEEVGDPFALCERWQGKMPPDEWLRLFKEAEATAKELEAFTMASAVAQRVLQTERGAAKIVQLLLLPNHPETTLDQAFQVLLEIGQDGLANVIQNGTGKVPAKKQEAPAA